MKKPIVVKIGGSTLGAHDTTLEDLVTLQKRNVSVVIVHGGAKAISDWLSRMGIISSFVNGLRVTDEKSLEVVTAVLAGLVNKELVAAIESLGGRAIGMSGVDGGLIQAQIRNSELGYVGEVVKVNVAPLKAIVEAGYIPVIAPVSLSSREESEKGIKLLNVNGDTIAGEIAAALNAEKLIFLTDVSGLCDREGKLIPYLTAAEADTLATSGVTSGGMAVKMEACLKALAKVPVIRIINGKVPHILLSEVEGKAEGTTITRR